MSLDWAREVKQALNRKLLLRIASPVVVPVAIRRMREDRISESVSEVHLVRNFGKARACAARKQLTFFL